MEQRLKTLEDLCELITKQVVEQNKTIMDVNKNLLNEIRYLRESFVKQDEDFEEFKSLLKKLYELNRSNQSQQINPTNNFMSSLFQIPPPPLSTVSSVQQMHQQIPNGNNTQINASILTDFINQSMQNNLSFQSERTPLNGSQIPPNLSQNNLNMSSSSYYSVPSSASALNQQQQQLQIQQNLLKQQQIQQQQQQQQQQKISTQQQPVQNVLFNKNQTAFQPQQQSDLKFAPSLSTTSTPQAANQFLFNKQQQLSQPTNQTQHQQQIQQKPPIFQLSPAKPMPLIDTTNKEKPAIFDTNIFKLDQKPSSQHLSGATSLSSNNLLFKAPQPTTLEQEDDENGASGNPEEYEPQIDFKPIVHLKEVDVKSGEEDENVLFVQRCKLFRFDSATKEWKEKGVGELKLLKHKKSNAIRLLMRREQVLKLCANHRITSDMKLTELSPKQYSWIACDFSENESKNEVLLAKFKTQDEASKFRTEFEKAVSFVKSTPATNQETSKSASSNIEFTEKKSSLSEQFKTDNWKCDGCYVSNKKEISKCVCCGKSKTDTSASNILLSSSSKTNGLVFSPLSTPVAPTSNSETKVNEIPKPNLFSFGLANNSSQTAALFSNPSATTKPLFSFGSPNFQGSAATANSSIPNTMQSSNKEQLQIAKSPSTGFAPISFQSQQQQQQQHQQSPKSNIFSSSTTLASSSNSLFNSNAFSTFESLSSAANKQGTELFGTNNKNGENTLIGKTGLSFTGGIQANTQNIKPLFESLKSASAIPTEKEEVEETGVDGENQNPEDYEPQIEFKPLVKLHEVEVKTGEEDEEHIFKQRCKLYRFEPASNEWKEKGTGEMKILKHKKHNMFRILMRRDQVLKICANHRITLDLNFEIFNEKQVRWHAQDYSEGEGKHETLAARFRSEEDAKKFKNEAENAQKILASETSDSKQIEKPEITAISTSNNSLKELFKNENTWTCDGCYVKNKQDIMKCIACNFQRKDVSLSALSSKAESESKSLDINNSNNKVLFGMTSSSTNPPILFGSQSQFNNSKSNDPFKLDFGSKAFNVPQQPQEQSNSIFTAKVGLSFADLAKEKQPFGFSGGFKSVAPSNVPLFASSIKQVSTIKANEEGGEEEHENPEEYEPQIDFKPLVKLQEVEVKTGEEDEEPIFKQRCKLYRFDNKTKEWKEKGTGEIKIMHHKQKENSYRILMRRDQVLKICANHRITSDMKMELFNQKQIRWLATDCAEGEPRPEYLAASFRNEEDAKKFKNEFERAQKEAANTITSSSITSHSNLITSNNVNNLKNSLASLVIQGSWTCNTCLSSNKGESIKCASCETPKPVTSINENDKIEIIHTVTATQDQVQKARSFKLPDNFYLYLNKPPCKGCPGCENEE